MMVTTHCINLKHNKRSLRKCKLKQLFKSPEKVFHYFNHENIPYFSFKFIQKISKSKIIIFFMLPFRNTNLKNHHYLSHFMFFSSLLLRLGSRSEHQIQKEEYVFNLMANDRYCCHPTVNIISTYCPKFHLSCVSWVL